MTEPIPAATLILLRPAGSGAPEVLMVERAAQMAFGAGALVFPGGRVDPEDRALAATIPQVTDSEDAAARIAAIRETIEEAGIAVGLSADPDTATLARMRDELAAGTPFGTLLDAAGLRIVPEALVPFARWCPNFREARNFDARFYLAAAPADALAVADGGETVSLAWAAAAAILRDAEDGRGRLMFPTRCNLQRIAGHADYAGLVAEARSIAPMRITPWIEDRDGGSWLCIPDDRGYPVTAEPLDRARRH